MAYKTPGVYIKEKNAFPNSVVEVATAVPAFLGYTEKADNKGTSLAGKPWRITSFSEFLNYFGGAPKFGFNVRAKTLTAAVTASNAAAAATVADSAAAAADADATAAQTVATAAAAALAAATDAATKQDAQTANDKATAANAAAIAKKAAADNAKAAADKANADAAAILADANATAKQDAAAKVDAAVSADFKVDGVEYLVTQNAGQYLLYLSMMLFFQNGGGACYIVSVGDYSKSISASDLTTGIDSLKKEQEPTMLVIPDAVNLAPEICISVQQAALSHCGLDMKNRFSILDVHSGFQERTNPNGDCVTNFRDALGTDFLNFGAAYYPWVNTTIVQDDDLDYTIFTDPTAQTLIKNLLMKDMNLTGAAPTDNKIARKNWDDKINAVNAIGQTIDQFLAANPAPSQVATMTQDQLKVAFVNRISAVNKLLSLNSPVYVSLMSAAKKKLNLLPPSAAMAGVYTKIDNTRGVWKAPANVSLNSVVSPAVNINSEEQEDLNVTTAGKSVNAIRTFIGEGTLVWGARTLDGNSLDWRYINVRRTMIMLEESLRLATKAYVFEPNVANTWITIKSMARNFLTSIWKRGGLAGASPDDAFSVFVGLGETMTAQDILDGMLNVTILVALSRPAEFIEITFQQQMQKS